MHTIFILISFCHEFIGCDFARGTKRLIFWVHVNLVIVDYCQDLSFAMLSIHLCLLSRLLCLQSQQKPPPNRGLRPMAWMVMRHQPYLSVMSMIWMLVGVVGQIHFRVSPIIALGCWVRIIVIGSE